MNEVEFAPPRPRPKAGLTDGGKVVFHCANCKKGLAAFHITRPGARLPNGKPITWKMRARCCYCGDFSYIHTIEGMGHIMGFHEETDNPEEPIIHTDHTNVVEQRNSEGNSVAVIIVKERK